MKTFVLLFFIVSTLFSQVELNTASVDELIELNGIGKAKAAKIISYREQNNCFSSLDELSEIDGISKNIVERNRDLLTLGECDNTQENKNLIIAKSGFKDVLLDPINLTFVILIVILAAIDLVYKKDLKSQIVSVGVLGTFVGIFIGLQGFDPNDIINSVNDILSGLKTAFFTSIVGMSVATILALYEKLNEKPEIK